MGNRLSYGLRAPLFERLTQDETSVVLQDAALAESIRTSLERLLGSRACASFADAAAGIPLVTNYGVADSIDYTASSLSDRQVMAGNLEAAIRAFEQRLSSVAIEIVPSTDRARPLVARLRATVRLAGYERAVVFLLNGGVVTIQDAPS